MSTIIASRVKSEIIKKKLNKDYSIKQIFKYLSKYKKARTSGDGPWKNVAMLKYIEELIGVLGV